METVFTVIDKGREGIIDTAALEAVLQQSRSNCPTVSYLVSYTQGTCLGQGTTCRYDTVGVLARSITELIYIAMQQKALPNQIRSKESLCGQCGQCR